MLKRIISSRADEFHPTSLQIDYIAATKRHKQFLLYLLTFEEFGFSEPHRQQNAILIRSTVIAECISLQYGLRTSGHNDAQK
uniref:Uncharacterized protein n=1 Tax=Romanomermis culicivorax TaxID=13658 RepID=A0A915L9M7_ROMCU